MSDSRRGSDSRSSRQRDARNGGRRSATSSRPSGSRGTSTGGGSSRGNVRGGYSRGTSSASTRPRRARAEGGSPNSRRSRDGYALRQHNIRFNNKGGGLRNRLERLDRRTILVIVATLVLLIVLVLVVSSCTKGCSSEQQDDAPVNEQDARVAYGVDSATTTKLSDELDVAEKYEKLAQQADLYDDTRLIDLAIAEPDALDFVLSYPSLASDDDSESSSSATGEAFEGAAEVGELQQLWCWDERWAAVEYDGGPLAVTGSGPCALSVAIMYVSGDTSMTPGRVAVLATSAGADTGDSGMDSSFVTDQSEELGIDAQFYTPSSDNLAVLLAAGTPVLIDTRSDASDLGDEPHWIVVLAQNSDYSVTIFDPTSTANSSHSWAIGTIVSNANSLYSVAASTVSGESSTATE